MGHSLRDIRFGWSRGATHIQTFWTLCLINCCWRSKADLWSSCCPWRRLTWNQFKLVSCFRSWAWCQPTQSMTSAAPSRFLVGLCKTIVQALRGHVLMIWKCQQPLSWHVVAKDCNSGVAIHPCVVTEKDVVIFRLNGVLFAPCRFWLVVCCSVLRERLIDSLNTQQEDKNGN